ncbi:zinc finger BED domain-containing protein RICESLEEPER 2, partial [Tanacetum coccineum]
DQTINLNSDDFGHESNKDEHNKKNNAKKRKRKPSGGIGNLSSECWKYFDPKMERPDGLLIRMAYFVKDGLKGYEKAVETIGLAVKYIKNSSQRIEKFKTSIKKSCDSNRFLIAECPTRWNSTYDMLKSAIDLQEAFYNYSMNNASFSHDLKAIPRRPVAHLFYSEILDVDRHLREWEVVLKFDSMVEKMRLKHLMENDCIPKENEDEENTPLAFLTESEKEDKIKALVYDVQTNMGVLFALYNEKYGTNVTHNSSDVQKSLCTQSSNTTRRRGNTFLISFKSHNLSRSSGVNDELKKYLKEPLLELDDEEDFDILLWWKLNSPRFLIISNMAKDILLIQISTIAFESAFSTSGRVLDPYKNALSMQIVEALICTQSWICISQKNIYMDDLEDLLKDKEVIKDAL